MRCDTCSYEHLLNEQGHVLEGMNRGATPFYKLEFDVSMKGEELSNKSSTLGSDNKRGPRRDFVTLYFCPKCGLVQPRYSDSELEITLR
jgi:hypothetical protein